MVIIVTIGVSSSLCAPLIALKSQPVPFIVIVTLVSISLLSSCLLPLRDSGSNDERQSQLADHWTRDCESPVKLTSKRSKLNVSYDEERQFEKSFIIGTRFYHN